MSLIQKIKGFSENNPISEQQYKTSLTIIGHFFFLTYLLFSLIFYKERLLNFDSAYYTFHLIFHEDYFIIHNRTINYFTQWLPLIAIENEWSLKTVLLLYSSAFMLLHYLVFNLIVHLIKNVEAGIFFALALCLTMRYKFYTGISEITATLAFVALLIAWLTKNQFRFSKLPVWADWGIAFGIILLVYTGHPLAIWLVLVFVGFDMLYNQRWKEKYYWIWLGAVLILYAYRFLAIQEGSYEEGQMSRLENAQAVLSNYDHYEVYHIIKWFFQREYALPFVCFLGTIFWMLKTRKPLSAIYIFGAAFAQVIIVLIHQSYLRGRIYYMIDGYLVYIGVIWAMAIFLVLLKSEFRKLSLIVIIILLSFSVDRIYKKHDFYTQRLNYLDKTIEMHATQEQRKFIIPPKYFSWSNMWVPSIMSLETLMLSAVEDPKHAAVLHVPKYEEKIENLIRKEKLILGSMPHVTHKRLPKHYFDMPAHEYLEIKEVAWPQDK